MSTKYGAVSDGVATSVLSGLDSMVSGNASEINAIRSTCKASGGQKSARAAHKKSTMASGGGKR